MQELQVVAKVADMHGIMIITNIKCLMYSKPANSCNGWKGAYSRVLFPMYIDSVWWSLFSSQ
jgi:hypothetical protein